MRIITPKCVREVKQSANVADVVARKVALRSAGSSRLKGVCPFHSEKAESFYVDTIKGFYKCFGCGRTGDAITFVCDVEHLTFTAAVEALGGQFGIPIEYTEGPGDSHTSN